MPPLLEEPCEVAFHQGLHQLAPLPVEQLVQLVHAPLGGPCLPLEQLIGLLHAAIGLLHAPVGLLHAARSLLLHCGDLAENLPDLLRGRGFALSVAFGHRYARSSDGSDRRAFWQSSSSCRIVSWRMPTSSSRRRRVTSASAAAKPAMRSDRSRVTKPSASSATPKPATSAGASTLSPLAHSAAACRCCSRLHAAPPARSCHLVLDEVHRLCTLPTWQRKRSR